MKEKILEIVQDLLDDRNIILYALFILALLYESQVEIIVGGVLGYWAKGNAKQT